jgi:hypothetical protein
LVDLGIQPVKEWKPKSYKEDKEQQNKYYQEQ